jgi:thioredoxin-related protein
MRISAIALLFSTGFYVSSCAQTPANQPSHSDPSHDVIVAGTRNPNAESIHWMSFTDAVKLNEKDQKKVFVDVYTKWCGWCKRMDASTYEDPSVVAYINKNFHAVKLDAETKDTILYKDKVFTFIPESRANLIALELLGGKMSYPTSVYLDENFNLLGPAPGYQTPEQLLPQLKYFAEDIYKNKKWDEYQKDGK